MARRVRRFRDLVRDERGEIPVGGVLIVALIVIPLVLGLVTMKTDAVVKLASAFVGVVEPETQIVTEISDQAANPTPTEN